MVQGYCRAGFALVFAALLAGPARAEGALTHFSSVQEAEQAIAAGETEKARVEQRFAAEKTLCYKKFFTMDCLDKARERRREALSIVRDQDVAARAWLRRDKADQRDAALAQKRIEDERDARERAADVKAREEALERKRIASEERQREAQERNARTAPDTRMQKHEQAVRERRAQEAREQPEREKNVRDYQRKLQEAQEKQREFAARQAAPAASAQPAPSAQPGATAGPATKP